MNDNSSLSDFWRIRKSQDKILELKNLQEGLQSLASVHGQNVRVLWDDSLRDLYADSDYRADTILINPIPVKSYPVSGQETDVLAGQVLHSIGHSKLHPPSYYLDAGRRITGYDREMYQVLKRIEHVLHEAMIDQYMSGKSRTVQGYIDAARDYYRSRAKSKLNQITQNISSGRIDRDTVVDLWSMLLLYNIDVPENIPSGLAETLINILDESEKYLCSGSPSKRIAVRTLVNIWRLLEQYLAKLEQQQAEPETEQSDTGPEQEQPEPEQETGQEQPGSEPEPETEQGPEQETEQEQQELEQETEQEQQEPGQETEQEQQEQESSDADESEQDEYLASLKPEAFLDQPVSRLSEDEIRDLRNVIEHEVEDISSEIDLDRAYFLELARVNKRYAQELIRHTRSQTNSLAYLFQRWNRIKSRYVRGTEDGKLDQRLLYRGGLHNNHVFKSREIAQKLNMALIILLDSSASVQGQPWDIIAHCAASFVQAMGHRDDVDLVILGYSGRRIIRIWDSLRREFRIDPDLPGGNTPTHLAFRACREVLFRRFSRRPDKIIIHVTDAMPDKTQEATEEINLTKKSGIKIAAILTPGNHLERAQEILDSPYYTDDQDKARAINGLSYYRHIVDSYGNNVMSIDTWEKLPSALEEVTKGLLK